MIVGRHQSRLIATPFSLEPLAIVCTLVVLAVVTGCGFSTVARRPSRPPRGTGRADRPWAA
jgi:hypothetical protein